MTYAALEADPWNALYLDIPQNPDRELLLQAIGAAGACRYELVPKLEAAAPGNGRDFLEHVYENLWQRMEQFEEALGKLPPEPDWARLSELNEMAQDGRGFGSEPGAPLRDGPEPSPDTGR
jgi:hypothetical protein